MGPYLPIDRPRRTSTEDRIIPPHPRIHRRAPLYTPAERRRRDASPWTLVQGVLAPLQFAAFAVSLVLVLRCLATGEGYAVATASIVIKTALLLTIMVTGSFWERAVFGRWLLAPAFFWEDVVSFGVIALHLVYLMTLAWGAAPGVQMAWALAAYAAYVVNAGQFVLKLRTARLEAPSDKAADGAGSAPRGGVSA